MIDQFPQIRAAVVQAAPVLFDREATVEKTCRLTAEAAAQGANLALFPEALIPAYPRGLSFGTVVGNRSPEGRSTWQRYWANAVEVPGPATEALSKVARQTGTYLVAGAIAGVLAVAATGLALRRAGRRPAGSSGGAR